MTDEQIMQALTCCANSEVSCSPCPCKEDFGLLRGDKCIPRVCTEALNLITRQKEEIARLTVELDAMRGAANSYKMHYEAARVETASEIFDDFRNLCDEFLNRKILCHEFLAKFVELEKKYTEGKTDAEIH